MTDTQGTPQRQGMTGGGLFGFRRDDPDLTGQGPKHFFQQLQSRRINAVVIGNQDPGPGQTKPLSRHSRQSPQARPYKG